MERVPQQNLTHRRSLPIGMSAALTGIMKALAVRGTRALIVGGAVRDTLLGSVPKDIDVEVYGLTYEELLSLLSRLHHTDVVGRHFGVIKVVDDDGVDYDFSIPRRESKTGAGHRDFLLDFDQSITPLEAAARRDFTINALAYDPLSEELHDYFGGVNDLENLTLRHTSAAFVEDPLRVLRGMQFASRFGMRIAPETAGMIREHLGHDDHYRSLARERIAEEWMKLAIKARWPGAAISYLRDTGWIRFFPEIANLSGVPQDPEWHPEGDVDVHTAYVMDEAAHICDREGVKGDDRAVLVFAALGHDFAKAHTTQLREKHGQMRWTAYGHEEASGPMVEVFLTRIGVRAAIVERVRPLVERHLAHIRYVPGSTSVAAVRRLAFDLHPATIEELSMLIEADASGRPPLPKRLPDSAQVMRQAARQDGAHVGRPRPLVRGRDVLPFYQYVPGPYIGQAVSDAYNAQLQADFSDLAGAQSWLRRYLRPKVSLLKGEDVLARLAGNAGPAVGNILNEAWEAQHTGRFRNRVDALAWLDDHMGNRPIPGDRSAG